MPTREYPTALDQDTLDVLIKAFVGACADLGVNEKTLHSRWIIARKVVELVDKRDPEGIRAAVVADLKRSH